MEMMEMSLKQKIQQKAKTSEDIANELDDFEEAFFDKYANFSNDMIPHEETRSIAMQRKEEWVRVDDVVALVDEQATQILLIQKKAFEEFKKNPNNHDRYWAGQIDAFLEVLKLLVGEEEGEKKQT